MADPHPITNGSADALLEDPDLEVEEDLVDDVALDDEADAVADLGDDTDDDLDLELDEDLELEPERVSPAVMADADDDVEAAVAEAPAPVPSDLDARIRRLEEAAQALADAEVTRDGRRVKRKVTAATGGAGLAGLIPVILQAAGAFDLSPEAVSAISAAAALLGAFAAGWSTPERKPSLPSSALETLSGR